MLIPAARAVNDGMPKRIAEKAFSLLNDQGVPSEDAVVTILGFAYLEDSDDTRNSPTEMLVNTLSPLIGELRIHDPYVKPYQTDVYETLKGSDIVIVMVAHAIYKTLDLVRVTGLLQHPIMLDGRRVINASKANQFGLQYYAIGLGKSLTSRTD